MCIIVAKNKGVKMPDYKTLSRCFTHNPDGAGIMWVEENIVHIRKGFMNYTELDSFISKLGNRLDLTDTALVMHFRITTHGSTSPQNCHPFPISRKIKDLKKNSIVTDIGVAHNGIIPIKCIPKLSDTQTYIAKRLSAIKNIQPDFYNNPYIMRRIENEIQSKMCFLTKYEQIHTIGKFIEEDGILYSNSSYKEYSYFRWFDSFSLYDNELLVCPVYGIIIGNGDIAESDGYEYFIDKDERVYEYDYTNDLLIPLEDTQAFTYQGMPYRYKDSDAIIMDIEKGGER